MPSLTYSNSAFVTLTRISSSIVNAYFTDITTWANTTKLDYLNLQTAGVRASNMSSQASAAGLPLVADGAGAASFSNISTIHSGEIYNLSLTAAVGSNLLTVAVKTAAGADATSSTPIRLGFRNSTLATGTFQDRTITAALSVATDSTTDTFGLTSGQNQYIYVYAIDNSGTVELALAGSRCFDEGTRYSTTAMNSTSNNALVLYSTTARSNVAIRLIGRLLSNQASSGTYATAIAEISLNTSYTKKQERSEVWVQGNGGRASGNTTCMYFGNSKKNVGTAITYASSNTTGDTFTINEDGLYSVTFTADLNSNYGAITLNSTGLTTGVENLNASFLPFGYILGADGASGSTPTSVGGCLKLTTGDVLRAQIDVDPGSNNAAGTFHVTKISD